MDIKLAHHGKKPVDALLKLGAYSDEVFVLISNSESFKLLLTADDALELAQLLPRYAREAKQIAQQDKKQGTSGFDKGVFMGTAKIVAELVEAGLVDEAEELVKLTIAASSDEFATVYSYQNGLVKKVLPQFVNLKDTITHLNALAKTAANYPAMAKDSSMFLTKFEELKKMLHVMISKTYR